MTKKRYTEPVILSIEDALGIDEDKINEKQARRLMADQSEMIEDHKSDIKELKKLENDLDEAMIVFETDDEDREALENVYDKRIRIILGMAGRFNPLSTYGRKMLKSAVDCRREFEELAGPLVSTITKNNIKIFKTVLTEDLYEDISVGRRNGLGAIRTKNGKTYGVGAVVYYVEKIPAYEKPVLRIEWLYVNEKFRGRGLSYFLLGELISQAVNAQLDVISAEFDSSGEYNYLLGYILGTLKFEFGTGLSPEAVIRLGDLKGYTRISAEKKGAATLSSVDDINREKMVKTAFKKYGYKGYLSRVPAEYINNSISCCANSQNALSGILLAHQTPSGVIRAEYEGLTDGEESTDKKLISMFLESASMECDDDTLVMIPVDMEEIGEYLETVCPGQMGEYTVEGVLELPEGWDMDEQAVNDLLNE